MCMNIPSNALLNILLSILSNVLLNMLSNVEHIIKNVKHRHIIINDKHPWLNIP